MVLELRRSRSSFRQQLIRFERRELQLRDSHQLSRGYQALPSTPRYASVTYLLRDTSLGIIKCYVRASLPSRDDTSM